MRVTPPHLCPNNCAKRYMGNVLQFCNLFMGQHQPCLEVTLPTNYHLFCPEKSRPFIVIKGLGRSGWVASWFFLQHTQKVHKNAERGTDRLGFKYKLNLSVLGEILTFLSFFCNFVIFLFDRQVEIQIDVEFVGRSVDGVWGIHTGVVKRPQLTNPLLRQSRKSRKAANM